MSELGSWLLIRSFTPKLLKMCFNPKIVPVKNTYVVNSLYGYNSPFYDNSLKRELSLPCGKCDDCRVSHSKEWALRCMLEYNVRSTPERAHCWFVTLTYDDRHLPFDCKLKKDDVSLFIKKLRHYFERKDKSVRIKYFVCGEYGSWHHRPHYHILFYGLPLKDLDVYKMSGGEFLFHSKLLKKIWGNGAVVIGRLCYQTAFYTARYTLKKIGTTDVFMSCSNGIGRNWCLKNIDKLINDCYLQFGKFKFSIPRYFCKIIRKHFRSDVKYVEWCKRRKDNTIDNLNVKALKYNTGEYFFTSDDVKFKNRFLKSDGTLSGLNEVSEVLKIDARNRSYIRQSLYELYKRREF